MENWTENVVKYSFKGHHCMYLWKVATQLDALLYVSRACQFCVSKWHECKNSYDIFTAVANYLM